LKARGRIGSVLLLLLLLATAVPTLSGAVADASKSTDSPTANEPLRIPGTLPIHMAGMLPPLEGLPDYSSATYDEQLGLTFTQNFTSLAYSVTAVEQTDSASGTGPAYLLNGLSSNGFWYQVGVSWDWGPGLGFGMNYEVWDSTGSSVLPTNGGGGLQNFSGAVNEGDQVLLELYFSGGNVTMAAIDQSTGASASESYSAVGSTQFTGSSSGPASSNGFFTGLMTEWYHASAYYGNEAKVVYSQSVALASGWMWMDEVDTSDFNLVFSACANSCTSPTSWSNPTQLQSFSSNGATESSDAYEFVTGSGTPVTVMTLSYSVQGSGVGYSPPVLSYYLDGLLQEATLNQYPTNYTMDTGSQWSVSNALPGSSSIERWQTAQQTAGYATVSQTIDFAYYHQDLVTFATSVQGGGSGYSTPTVSYEVFGTVTSTATGIGVWADIGSYYSYTNPLSGSSSTERWFAGQLSSGGIDSAGTIYVVYFHQFLITLSYEVVGGGSPSPPLFAETSLGQAQTGPLTHTLPGQQVNTWADSGSAYQLLQTLPGSTSTERWYGSGASGDAGGPATVSATYYHQFYIAVSYAILDGGTPPAPTLLYEVQGSPSTYPLTENPSLIWADDNSWSLPPILNGSMASERWAAAAGVNGTVDSNTPISPQYFHQFTVIASFSVSDDSSPSAPSLSSGQFGEGYSAILQRVATTYWLDNGASWSVDNPLTGSGPSERWVALAPLKGVVSSAETISLEFFHQFYVTVQSAQPSGGIVSPSEWANATVPLQLSAKASAGWQFEAWTGTGTGSYTGAGNKTSIVILAPLVENATFYPGLTVIDGGDGGVSTAWTGGRSAIDSGSRTLFVPVGTNVSLVATPSSILFAFSGYAGATNSTRAASSIRVVSPATVRASFAPNYIVVGGLVGGVVLAVLGATFFALRRRGRA